MHNQTEKEKAEMKIEKQMRVGEIATVYPLATRVLDRHGIGYCCEGGRSLEEACDKRGVDFQVIVGEIRDELEETEDSETRWDEAPLEDLIKHILVTYHEPLREELPRLEAMASRVAQVHGEKMPDVLPQLAEVVTGLRTELEQHMMKEEQILFPLVIQGETQMIGCPIEVMEHEHESAGKALRRLRELTSDFQVPEGACNTWRALWHGLEALEKDLHHHIHLENNILFPRALRADAAQ